MKKLNCKVVLLEVSTPNPDIAIYRQTQKVFGDIIYEPKLEYSTNSTYIRNISLINDRKVATNDQSRYKFYDLHFVSDRPVEGIGYRVDLQRKSVGVIDDDKYYNDYPDKFKIIEATINPQLNLPLIPETFIEDYIAKNGKIPECEINLNEDGSVKLFGIAEVKICSVYNPSYAIYTYAEAREIARESWDEVECVGLSATGQNFDQWWDARN